MKLTYYEQNCIIRRLTFARNPCRISETFHKMTPTKSQAIQTALSGDWKKAVVLNKELLDETPTDIDTLNRLGHAYSELGKVKEAKSTYQKVLRLDTKNPIALRNFKRLSSSKNLKTDRHPLHILSTMFLEESGKTKVVELVNVAEPKLISQLSPGQAVHLRIKRMKVFVLDENNQYIGMLPDNLGKRLLLLMNGGNTYEAYIKSIQDHNVSVFMREIKRANKFRNQPTFTLLEKTKSKIDKLPRNEDKQKPKEEHQEEDEEEEES